MPFKALITEDDPNDQKRIQQILQALGAEVRALPGTSATVTELQSGASFDLAVLKTDHPEMTGQRLLELIRGRLGAAAYRVIGTSAATLTRDELTTFARLGFLTVLPRPIQAWRLRELVFAIGLSARPTAKGPEAAGVIEALAFPLRLQLMGMISRQGEATASQLAKLTENGRQKLLHHLEGLEHVGLLSSRTWGRRRFFSVRTAPIEAAAHSLILAANSVDELARKPSGRG